MKPSAQARVFRPGATVPVFFVWAALSGVVAGFLIQHGITRAYEAQSKNIAFLMAGIAILLGPVPFFIHFVRMCVSWVAVEEGGLLLSSGRAINWSEIRAVELKEGAFKGLLRADPVIFLVTAGCYAVVYYVVLPSMALLTPWHPRVIVTLASGENLVFRDLTNIAGFVKDVEERKGKG